MQSSQDRCICGASAPGIGPGADRGRVAYRERPILRQHSDRLVEVRGMRASPVLEPPRLVSKADEPFALTGRRAS